MPYRFTKVGRGHVQRDTIDSSNIFEGMVTRNVTEQTYTTSTDGTAVALNPGARTISGYMPVPGGSPTFAARQPKGMLLRTEQGPVQVHGNPYAGYNATRQQLMAVEGLGGGSDGIAFLVSAGVMYEIIAAACSSPQTTELNASTRADTLMKWVHLGVAQGLLFVGLAAYFDRTHARPILIGGGMAAVLLYVQYNHAKEAGLASDLPGTESH